MGAYPTNRTFIWAKDDDGLFHIAKRYSFDQAAGGNCYVDTFETDVSNVDLGVFSAEFQSTVPDDGCGIVEILDTIVNKDTANGVFRTEHVTGGGVRHFQLSFLGDKNDLTPGAKYTGDFNGKFHFYTENIEDGYNSGDGQVSNIMLLTMSDGSSVGFRQRHRTGSEPAPQHKLQGYQNGAYFLHQASIEDLSGYIECKRVGNTISCTMVDDVLGSFVASMSCAADAYPISCSFSASDSPGQAGRQLWWLNWEKMVWS